MIKIGDNPQTRYPQKAISESKYPWWLAKVKPRQEKAFAFDLQKSEIEYYLPMYTKITRRKDNNKPRKSVMVLFPGYVPFCIPKNEKYRIFLTNRVVNIVEIKHQKKFIHELEQIYFTLEHNIPLEPLENPENLTEDTMVMVQRGPLRGIKGIITRIKGIHKLILSVEPLGRAKVAVDIGDVVTINS